jgi:Cu-Zn family superoxide dismutase
MALDIAPRSGSKLTGTVTLSEESTGLRVAIALAGVSPGDHGAHVHETPDCGAPDAKSAGGHYNPDSHAHGLPSGAQHHIGDLGNIGVGKDGKGTLEITIADANLKAGDPHSFLGRSIIIHEKKDDGGQPVGNAGGRIGCVEIK